MGNQLPHAASNHRQLWFSTFLTLALLCGGLCLLFWNECSVIQAVSFIAETMKNVVILPSALSVFEKNNGKLVHLSGMVSTDEPIVVNEYGIAVSAVKLKHRVQMYQWVQEMRREGEILGQQNDASHYRYFTDWRDTLINSSLFFVRMGHENPRKFPHKTKIHIAEEVTVGRFSLSSTLKQMFDNFVIFTSDARPENKDIKLHAGLYYHCDDVWNPEVGDIRIQFSYAGMVGEHVTIIAKQVGVELHPFVLPSGKTIAMVRPGTWPVNEMLLHGDRTIFWGSDWILRAFGWLWVFLVIKCSRFIQTVVCRYWNGSSAVMLKLSSTSVMISVALSLLVISLPWLWTEPILGVTLFLAALCLIMIIVIKYHTTEAQKFR